MRWATPWETHRKRQVRAQLGNTTIEGLATGWYSVLDRRHLMLSVVGAGSIHLDEREDWLVTLLPDPIVLPKEPGTVIAIGDWWLVRLRSYEGAPSAWELLPWNSDAMRHKGDVMGVKAQCVYSDEWVLAEAEQEGSFEIIAVPERLNASTGGDRG